MQHTTLDLLSSSGGWEASVCYALFIIGFAIDFSGINLVYLVSMLLVPLLLPGKAKLYWRLMLVYTEVSLIRLWRCPPAPNCWV